MLTYVACSNGVSMVYLKHKTIGEVSMLAENIKTIRKQRGMTQEELAARLNVVRQTVSKWEKGLSVPDAELLKKLAEILETDVSSLLGAKINTESNANEIAEQLSRINEQLATKARNSRRILFAAGIVILSIIVLNVLLVIFGPTTNINESTSEVYKYQITETQ